MREISCEKITGEIERLCIRAATVLPPSLAILLECAQESEESEAGAAALGDIVDNFRYAAFEGLPICQDTGVAVVFADVGQEVHITGGAFEDAINEGVRRGYVDLRKSVVLDPLRRVNTDDNTPCVLHTRIVPGDKLALHVAPKGFGSENMSAVKMLLPTGGAEAVLEFIVETASRAGSNPCPPIVLGVGLGGTLEQCALAAKRALLRDMGQPNPDELYSELEREALFRINRLGIGPQGFGGRYTAVAVNIEACPTHIAGLPCAVNVGCHATRHASAIL